MGFRKLYSLIRVIPACPPCAGAIRGFFMTSEETALAQVMVELLSDSDIELSDYEIVIEEADAALTLPAIVVSARHQEDTGIILETGAEVKRYAVNVEVRGIQLQDSPTALDEAVNEIDVAFHPVSPVTVTSGDAFQGIMIDVQRESDSTLPRDSRIRKVGYDIFAATGIGTGSS